LGIVPPNEPQLLGLVSRIAPALTGGNDVVALALRERPARGDRARRGDRNERVPGGVVNFLTGYHAELAPWLASHMDVNAIDITGADGPAATDLEIAAPRTLKRVVVAGPRCTVVYEISAFLELKTVWHPIGTMTASVI